MERQSSKEIIIMPLPNGLQKVALAGAIWHQQEAERVQLERERQEQARLETERNSPQALAERDRAMLQASAEQAIIKQQTQERMHAEAATRAKKERNQELQLIGDALAQRLIPAITQAIAAGFAQSRTANRRTIKMLPVNAGDTVNVRLSIHQAPTVATVVSVDQIRRLVTVTHGSGALTGKAGTIGLDMVREQNDQQFALPNGVIWTG
jgi:hypothetical protein